MVVTSEPCEIRVHHIQFVLAELANIYDGIYAAGNGLDVFLMDKLKIDQETCPICEAPNPDKFHINPHIKGCPFDCMHGAGNRVLELMRTLELYERFIEEEED